MFLDKEHVGKSHRRPVSNCISRVQAPKPEAALAERTGHEQCDCDSSRYHWNQCLRVGAGIKGSGEVSVSRGWYCPECGAPADMGDGDNVPECCARCGSCRPAEWRD